MFLSAAVFTWTSTGTIYLRETGSVPQRPRLVRTANESRARRPVAGPPSATMPACTAGVRGRPERRCSSPWRRPAARRRRRRRRRRSAPPAATSSAWRCRPASPARRTRRRSSPSAFVEGPRVRVVLIAAPHLAPGDSSTDRPLAPRRAGPGPVVNGRTANAIVTDGGLWESQLAVWVPDAGNGGDRLAALARWQATADEAVAADIIASTRVMRSPGAVARLGAVGAAALGAGRAGRRRPCCRRRRSSPGAIPPAGCGTSPASRSPSRRRRSWTSRTHDPTEGANVSLNGKTFEVHVYLSPDGVRSVAAQGQDTVTSESIVVDGPQGQLHRWHRAGGRTAGPPVRAGAASPPQPGRPPERVRFVPDRCRVRHGRDDPALDPRGSATLGILDGASHHPHSRRRDRPRSHRGRRPHPRRRPASPSTGSRTTPASPPSRRPARRCRRRCSTRSSPTRSR